MLFLIGVFTGFCLGGTVVLIYFRYALEKEKIAKAIAETRLQEIEKNLIAQKNLLLDAESRWKETFENLSARSLSALQENARVDLGDRQKSLESLIKPLQESLQIYQQRLQQTDSQQTQTLSQVHTQITSLSEQSQTLAQETQQLRKILGSGPARGKWGEETLRRLVEVAGMSPHCDFSEQMVQGDAKPDLVVHLPENRLLIIDAKVPDLNPLAELHSADESRRKEILVTHAQKLRQTIKSLADRAYPRQFPNALDYVVLFLPSESLFSTALEGDPHLIISSAERKILLTTPSSLIALLRTVSICWQQHHSTENAHQIVQAGIELYERISKFIEHFEKLGAQLQKTVGIYNEASGSYERRILPSIDRLKKLGVTQESDPTPSILPIEQQPRLPPSS